MQEDVKRLYTDTAAFYIRDWSTCRFWCLRRSWNQPSVAMKGQLYISYAWYLLHKYRKPQ